VLYFKIEEEKLQEKFKNQFTQTLIECQPQLSKKDFIEMLKERIAQDSEMTREENTTTIAEENSTTIAEENATIIAEENATTTAEENATTIAEENAAIARENAMSSMQDA
jgi:hypothetical protein